MKDISYLKSLHDEILAYTKAHDDLSESHQWLFDLPPFKDELFNPKHIVFAINPGESEKPPTQTEETRFFDLHEENKRGSREKLAWTRAIARVITSRKIIQTELFFWSTKTVKVLEDRFGPLHKNPHLPFCCEKNRQLINYHKPESIICSGFKMQKVVCAAFGLTEKLESVIGSDGHRLIERYSDGKRHWVFTKHFTGARHFTKEDKSTVKSYIDNLPILTVA